jgi:hypothetical protein
MEERRLAIEERLIKLAKGIQRTNQNTEQLANAFTRQTRIRNT